MLKDFSIGFQRTYFVGQDEVIKIIDDAIPGTDELEMRFIRVRYQNQRVIPFERTDELFRNHEAGQEHRRPGLAEVRQIHFQFGRLAQVSVELGCRDLAPFVAADPRFIPEDLFKSIPRDGT